MQRIEQTILIQAPPLTVWDTLTKPDLMKQWMGEPAMAIEVITDWQVGHPIVIQGFHQGKFENRGTVWQFEPTRLLEYDYLSSISALADKAEHHTLLEFRLNGVNNQTVLTLTISNFPSESIFKPVHFYWKATLDLLKKMDRGPPHPRGINPSIPVNKTTVPLTVQVDSRNKGGLRRLNSCFISALFSKKGVLFQLN